MNFSNFSDRSHLLIDIIRAGANINIAKASGWTSIHMLTYEKKLAEVAELIQMKADINIKDVMIQLRYLFPPIFFILI
jgi:UDP-N-acetylglucosamine enolpyruvyl transferase